MNSVSVAGNSIVKITGPQAQAQTPPPTLNHQQKRIEHKASRSRIAFIISKNKNNNNN